MIRSPKLVGRYRELKAADYGCVLASTRLPVAWIAETGRRLSWIAERALVLRWALVLALKSAEPENHKCVMEES